MVLASARSLLEMQNLIPHTRPTELESEFQKISPNHLYVKFEHWVNSSWAFLSLVQISIWFGSQTVGAVCTPQKGFLGCFHCMRGGVQTKNGKGKTLLILWEHCIGRHQFFGERNSWRFHRCSIWARIVRIGRRIKAVPGQEQRNMTDHGVHGEYQLL